MDNKSIVFVVIDTFANLKQIKIERTKKLRKAQAGNIKQLFIYCNYRVSNRRSTSIVLIGFFTAILQCTFVGCSIN